MKGKPKRFRFVWDRTHTNRWHILGLEDDGNVEGWIDREGPNYLWDVQVWVSEGDKLPTNIGKSGRSDSYDEARNAILQLLKAKVSDLDLRVKNKLASLDQVEPAVSNVVHIYTEKKPKAKAIAKTKSARSHANWRAVTAKKAKKANRNERPKASAWSRVAAYLGRSKR